MKKELLKLVRFSGVVALVFFLFSSLVYTHGLWHGMALGVLAWTFYVLCIPAMHGRFVLGPIFEWLHLYPEPFVWSCAALINVFVVFKAPWLYDDLIITRLLYHVLSTPFWCWSILCVAAFGTFYRTIVRRSRIERSQLRHRFMQHIIMLVGLFLVIFLLLEPLVFILNLTMNA